MKWHHLFIVVPILILVVVCVRRFKPEIFGPGDAVPSIEQYRAEADAAVKAYRPVSKAALDDLSADLRPLLFGLPFVRRVEVSGAEKPTWRIIQLRDWHHVPRDMLEAERGPITDADFAQQQREVQLVEIEQKAILRCLIEHHGLKAVLIEGLTPEMMPNLNAMVQTLQYMAEVESKADREERDEIRDTRIELGAAVQLLATGELAAVLPLDREKELAEANPLGHGRFRRLDKKNAAREAAMIEACKRHGPVSIIILGGAHELAAAGVQVIRATTKSYPGE